MDLHIFGRITETYRQKQADAGSLSSTVPDAVASAKRVEVNAETNKNQALALFYDAHFSDWEAWAEARRLVPVRGDAEFDAGFDTAFLEALANQERVGALPPASQHVERDFLKRHVALSMVKLLYVLERDHPRFGRLIETTTVQRIWTAFRVPTRVLSRGFWTSDAARVIFEDGVPLPADEVRANYEDALDNYAARTANPRQHEQGDPEEKEGLGNSVNLMEEIEVSTNAYVLDRARTAIEAINWQGDKGNMCCLIRSLVMLTQTRWAVNHGVVTPEATEGKEAFKLDDLSPQDAAKKYGDLARNTDAVGQVLGILKFMRASARTLQAIATSKRDMGTVDFTAILISMVAPMLRRAIDEIYQDFENSPLASLDQIEQFKDLRRWLREKKQRIQRDSRATASQEVAGYVNESEEESLLSVIVKCGPAIDVLDKLVFPVLDGTRELLQHVLVEVYERITKRAKIEMDTSELSVVNDRTLFLNQFMKWVDLNIDPLLTNPRLCTSVEPDQDDIDSFIDSLKGVGGRGPGKGTVDVIQGTLHHAIDPQGFELSYHELRGRLDRSPEEDRELEAMDHVRLIWAL
jgi:hypothetical protein